MSYTKCRPFYLGWNVLILNWCRLKTSSFGSWLSGCHQASHFNFDYVMPVVVKRHRTTIERNNSIACRPKTWAINSSKWSEAAKQIRLCLAELIVRQWQFGGWSASEMKSYWKLRQADVPGDASICARSPSFGGQLQLISAASVLWAIMGRMRARPEVRPTMKSRPLPDGTARERGACWAGSGAVGLRQKKWQNGWHFAVDVFENIFLTGNCCILVKIPSKVVHYLKQCWPSSLVHICVTKAPICKYIVITGDEIKETTSHYKTHCIYISDTNEC